MKIIGMVWMICFGIHGLTGQRLPVEYEISEDGRRLTRGTKAVEGLYDTRVVRRMDLKFEQSNWQSLLAQNYNLKTDIPAALILEDKTYTGVGVRYRGQTSYLRVPGDKKSFSIAMDFSEPDQDLEGYEELNLNNSFDDPTMMREVLYQNLTRKYNPSLKASFVHLFINGIDWGVYISVQNLDGDYEKEWFSNDDGTRWRCERTSLPGGPAGPQGFGAGTSSLNYLGEDTNSYKPHYTLKRFGTGLPWTDLVRVTRVLNHSIEVDSLNRVLDVDRALWFLAKEILFVDDDSYVNKGGMDYYIYYDPVFQRLTPLEYDANSVMNGISSSWGVFYRENDNRFPLCNKLFKNSDLRQRYLAHVRTLINDLFRESVYVPLINRYFNQIDSLVKKDTKKLMTYEQFVSGKEFLKTWMDRWKNTLASNTEVNRTGVMIDQTAHLVNSILFASPDPGQEIVVQTRISGVKKAKSVFIHYGLGFEGPYTRIAMMDDGLHGDATAGDGIYGTILPGRPAGTYVRYYVEVIANDGFGTVTFDPQGAENDVYIYRVNLATSENKGVVINEVMSANTQSVADQDDEYDDWIELYNTTNTTIDLSHWILTDNPDNLDKYRIPQGITIPANGYLIVWADEDGKQQGLHANFKLSASGEPLILLDSIGQMVDSVEIPALQDDVAYARKPNGMGGFVIKAHTFNKNNDGTTPLEFSENKDVLRVYPNPSKAKVTLEWTGKSGQDLRIYNILGQLVHSCSLSLSLQIDVSQWLPGTYFLKSGNSMTRLIIP